MSAGVPSSIVQGVVISALSRFASATSDAELNRLIGRALERMIAPVREGGALDYLVGRPFLEECTSRSHVLNGCVYGLFGLYDAADSGHGDALSAQAIEQTLVETLDLFTTPEGWSQYALDTHGMKLLASHHYHLSHIDLFAVIAVRTHENRVWRTRDRWVEALNNPLVRTHIAFRKAAQTIWARDVRRLPLR